MINQEKPKSRRKWILPLVLLLIVWIFAFYMIGNIPHSNSGVYAFSEGVTVGRSMKSDFAPVLIPLLPSESTGGPYSFYLGSGVGFPPMGLKLDMNGVLKGTPTGTGDSKFQVCVKDVGGRSACRTYSMSVGPKSTTATKPTLNTNSTGNSGQNTNVVQGTTRTEKWEGTFTNHNVTDSLDRVCTYDTTASISICLTRQGQNFEGPINFPNGFKETSYAADPTDPCPPPPPLPAGTVSDMAGNLDANGNLKFEFLRLEYGIVYTPGLSIDNFTVDTINSAVMAGNSMTVKYDSVFSTGNNYTSSSKGSLTATKVADSCN